MEETKKVEIIEDIEIPEEFKKDDKKYGHGKCINESSIRTCRFADGVLVDEFDVLNTSHIVDKILKLFE